MADRIRFPKPVPSAGSPAETSLILTLANGVGQFVLGGPASYIATLPWKLDEGAAETPFVDIVLEFTASDPVQFGDGSIEDQLGIFGVIGDLATGAKFLIGILGINRGGQASVIPLWDAPDVGYAQLVCNVGLYDGLAIGGVEQNVVVGESLVTVKARPIFCRSYYG